MRLLYLANAASIHALKWVNWFARRGHEVHLASWRAPGPWHDLAANVRFHRLLFPPHHLARYGTLVETVNIWRSIRPELVHAHYVSHYGVVAASLSRVCDAHPLVLTAWGSDILRDETGAGKRLQRAIAALKVSDCVTCDSPHMVNRLLRLGAPPESLCLINFGVDTDSFSPQPRGRDIRERLGIEDALVVISTRNLRPVYDVGTLIRAVPCVLAVAPRTIFLIVGDGEERQRLAGLARDLGVSASVVFIGQLRNDALPDYLNSADIYVSTSQSDAGLAASTAEAMACALPPVVTDFGDNGAWVRNGETGYLFPCGDAPLLAQSLLRLIDNHSLRRQLGIKARREVIMRNDYAKEMVKMERVYAGLIERSAR